VGDPREILIAGIAEGLHLGAQLYVEHRNTIIDFACGEARPGIPMRTDSIMQWFSSGKPLTAICIGQLEERRDLLLEDEVTRFIPEFGANGKESITIWHLLTHTAGIRADQIARHLAWEETIRFICQAPLEPKWIPGRNAGYSTQASWFILAEIIQRITNAPFPEYIRRELFEPLGMRDSWMSLPRAQFEQYDERIAPMFNMFGGKQSLAPLQDAAGMEICRPGASARGPIRELGRFYHMLLRGGELDGRRYVEPATIDLFRRRHRQGLYDQTFAHTLDYGLGFILNSNRYGAETVPYGYGRFASEETFGHSGAQSSCAFADPANELVVAWVANGMPGEAAHQHRQHEVNSAIYEQLGLSAEE
jgi:CubicO group peptidase (beta-lactamase class C family)